MNDEQIQTRKLQNMFEHQMADQQQEIELTQQVNALEGMVKPLMTREALSRYSTVKGVHPEVAMRALAVMAQLMQAKRLKNIDDAWLKALLEKLTSQKKEYNIINK